MDYGLEEIYYPGNFESVADLYSGDPEQHAHADAWFADRIGVEVPPEWLQARGIYANVNIRQFDSSEHNVEALAAFHLKLRRWQELTGQNTFRKLFSSQQDLLHIENSYVAPGGNFFIASDSNTDALAGFVGLKSLHHTPLTGEVKRLAVHPLYQGQGIARKLVSRLINWAEQESYDAIELGTSYDENARPLYEQLGFKITGFNDDSQDWLMRLEL